MSVITQIKTVITIMKLLCTLLLSNNVVLYKEDKQNLFRNIFQQSRLFVYKRMSNEVIKLLTMLHI